MNYIVLNGVNSNTITGLIIQELPPISKPLMRTQIDQIDGRDGDIVTKLGYSTVDKELSIGLHGNFDIDSVIEYFASEGTVIFSNEPDKYYRYQVLDQIDFERLVRFRTATVTMHCQPFKYEVNEDPIEEAGSTDTTGDIVSFETQSTDAVGVKVNVEPYQNLNGYDSPWVGGAGKNLCYGVAGQNNVVVAQCKSGVTYTFSLHNTGSVGFKLKKNSQSGTTVVTTGGAVQTSTVSKTFTADEDFDLFLNGYGGDGDSFTAVTSQFQLEVGSTATAWTPYENICPIYPATGKNILPNNLTWTSGLRDSNGNPTASGTSHYSNSFPCEPNTTYTGQGIKTESTSWRIYFLTADETWISRTEQLTDAEESFTTPSNCYLMQVQCRYTNDLSTNAQIERGNSPTQYVPYNAIGITRTGANLWDEQWETGTISSSTGANASDSTRIRSKNYIHVVPNEVYYIHVNYSSSFDGTIQLFGYGKNKEFIGTLGWYGNPNHVLFTASSNVYYIRFIGTTARGASYTQNDISINSPSSASQYEPYQGERYYPISDNPVYGGTLDVTTGVLTVDRVTETFTKDSAWYSFSTGTGNSSAVVQLQYYQNCKYVNSVSERNGAISSNGKEAQNYWTGPRQNEVPSDGDMCFAYSATGQLRFHRTDISSITDLASFKTNFPNTQIVYYLATPITYQLTPVQVKTLLGYNNIWTDSGTVTVSVPNMISVVNEGNTTAKPTMTIYGSGDIGVWLNGMQVFQIALGDTGNITIDAEQMEAYQGGILRNRLVTGDYSNFVLQKGENTISVTGNVTSVEITNYSRWL